MKSPLDSPRGTEVYWYYNITGRPGIPWIPGPPLTGFITHLQKGRFIMKQLKKLACRAVQELSLTFPSRTVLSIILGTAITTFGIYNIHQQADITEGGILGLILLFHFWFGMSSSILSPVLDALSYALGFRFLGKEFLKTSVFATLCMAGFFRLWELFPPVLPSLADYPLLAALAGGCFIRLRPCGPPGSFLRRGRCPGPGHLQGYGLPYIQGIPADGRIRAGAVPVVYPGRTYRILTYNSDRILLYD